MFVGWEGPELSFSIPQYGSPKVSRVIILLQQLSVTMSSDSCQVVNWIYAVLWILLSATYCLPVCSGESPWFSHFTIGFVLWQSYYVIVIYNAFVKWSSVIKNYIMACVVSSKQFDMCPHFIVIWPGTSVDVFLKKNSTRSLYANFWSQVSNRKR